MVYTPTVQTFKTKFARGQFPYGTVLPDILDQDITDAIAEAEAVFNPGLYPEDHPEIGTLCELYLTAYFLFADCDAADSGGQSRGLQTSRSADGVSESIQIPDWVTGELTIYWSNYYGQQWLLFSKPYLDGAVYAIGGATLP
jgi:hypothetical protein